jgi:hypothetical protein
MARAPRRLEKFAMLGEESPEGGSVWLIHPLEQLVKG